MNDHELDDPASPSSGGHSDLQKVERHLREFQGLLVSQRRSVPAPSWMVQNLKERGPWDQIASASDERSIRAAELKALYGEAVARVPGAMDEDLEILEGLGILLAEYED